MSEKRLTKRWISALERIYCAEIHDRLPLQSKAKVFNELAAEGLVEPYVREFGIDRFGTITVSGWALTQFGRFTYCLSCDDLEIDDEGRK